MSASGTLNRKGRVVIYGLLANMALVALKLVTGLLGNSYALVADAVESLVDIIGSLVVFGGVHLSRRDPDSDFPYGLGKAEGLAAFVVGWIVILAALGIGVQAVAEIRVPHHTPEPYTLGVLVAVIVIKELLHLMARRTAKAENSPALTAEAVHHRSDAITSLAAAIGISVALWGGEGWEPADDWAALFAAAIIFANGALMVRRAALHLLDASAPPEVTESIRACAAGVAGVANVEKLIVRPSGPYWFVDIHIHAQGDMSLDEAHRIAGCVRATLLQKIEHVAGVLVHMEPAESER